MMHLLKSSRSKTISKAVKKPREGKVPESWVTIVKADACRKTTLQSIQKMTIEFVKFVSRKHGLPQATIDNAGGKIFTYGSYRLGVYGPGKYIKC